MIFSGFVRFLTNSAWISEQIHLSLPSKPPFSGYPSYFFAPGQSVVIRFSFFLGGGQANLPENEKRASPNGDSQGIARKKIAPVSDQIGVWGQNTSNEMLVLLLIVSQSGSPESVLTVVFKYQRPFLSALNSKTPARSVLA